MRLAGALEHNSPCASLSAAKKDRNSFLNFSWVNFSNFLLLDAGIGYFCPDNRILRKISFLGTGSEVPILAWRPKLGGETNWRKASEVLTNG